MDILLAEWVSQDANPLKYRNIYFTLKCAWPCVVWTHYIPPAYQTYPTKVWQTGNRPGMQKTRHSSDHVADATHKHMEITQEPEHPGQ